MAVSRTVKEVFLPGRKRIALVAHDNRKTDLIDWARFNAQTLTCHELFATGTTGLLTEQLGLDSAGYRADRSAATSRSARRSPKGTLTS